MAYRNTRHLGEAFWAVPVSSAPEQLVLMSILHPKTLSTVF